MYEYSGAIHIHSTYSDGTGKIEEIAEAASESGLDFIIMTDHNTLKPKHDGYERWIKGVMVIIGYEINDINNKNHYLAFGLDELIGVYQPIGENETGCRLTANEYVKLVKQKGGIGFIAHPDEERKHLPQHPSYPWIAETDDYTGIEIWNHMSEWIEGMNSSNRLDRILHPIKTIKAPNPKTLSRWDNAAMKRHVTGIGGVDAHALKQNILGLFEIEIFPYKVLFKTIRTHVLLDEPIEKNRNDRFSEYKMNILDALKSGRCFVSNYYHGNACGFRFTAEYSGKTYLPGDTVKAEGNSVIIRTLAPAKCSIRIIHNGKTIHTAEGMNSLLDVRGKGVYRAECYISDYGWIFSNHIRIS
jgi:hypothetical protein